MNPNLDNPKRIDAMDAMEGGKLFPIKHGMSVGMLPNISISTESDPSSSSGSVSKCDQQPTTKVAKCFESGSALFWPEKRQNAPQIFFSKNATICVKGATIWEFFF